MSAITPYMPPEVFNTIAIQIVDDKTWKALSCTCHYYSKLENWPDERAVKKISALLKNMSIEAFNALVPTLPLHQLKKCTVGPGKLQQLLPHLQTGNLHLVVTGYEEGERATKIEQADLIKTVTLQGLRSEVNCNQVIPLLTNLSQLETLHINSQRWLQHAPQLRIPSGGYFPSFPSVKQISVQQDLNSQLVLKVLRLFPNLETFSMRGMFVDSRLVIHGKEALQKLEASLSKEQPLTICETKQFILSTLGDKKQTNSLS